MNRYSLRIQTENTFIGLIPNIGSNVMSDNSDTIERNDDEDQKLKLEKLIAEFGKEEFDDETEYEERK
ncbi:MAG TPA: hypothetical protein VIX38_05255 [Nitrososphaeraceae archaeon]